MRHSGVLAAMVAIGLVVCGCAAPVHQYAGSPGSVYDSAQQPPHTYPASSYDPATPIKEQDFGQGGDGAPPTR